MSEKEKFVKIPEQEFYRIMKYFLDEPSESDFKAIKTYCEEKLDKMVKHQIYTKFKTSETEAEREEARKEYLNKIGIHKNFQW